MGQEPRKWGGRASRWLILFGIPLVILLVGMWQWSRADAPVDAQEQIKEYQSVIAELDALIAQKGFGVTVTVNDNGKKVLAARVRSEYQKELADLQAGGLHSTSRHLQPWLALCTMVFSVLALAWSALGVVYQKRLGRKAMESRAILLATFQKGRKLLPPYMVIMVVLLFGGAIPMLVYEIMPILRHSNYSKGDMKIMLLLSGVALFLLYSGVKVLWDVWKASRTPLVNEPIEVMGQSVTRAQVPELWAFVDRVVSHTGAGMPDAIVVGLNEGFFVTEHPVKLRNGDLLPKGRVLYLPLPYMAFMSAAEVAAVIGHELGHFIGEDTLYSQHFSPIYSATVNHIVAVAGGADHEESWLDVLRRPATLFGEMFLDSFHEAVSYWSRQRELAADAVGAKVTHPIAVASSLLRITALEPHVSLALHENWDQGRSVEGGVLAHVRRLVQAHGMVDPSEHLQNRQSHPTDSHPELAVRLEALGQSATPALIARAMDPRPGTLLQELGLEAASEEAGPVSPHAAAPDVTSALQQELSGAAASARAEKIEELSGMVQEAREPKAIFDRTTKMFVMVLFFTLVLFAIGIAVQFTGNPKADTRWIGLGLCALGLGGMVWLVYLRKRKMHPALVIEQKGLRLFDSPELLEWEAIDDFDFTETSHMFIIKLSLDRQVSPPSLKVSKLRASFNKRSHELTVNLIGFDGKRAQQVAQDMTGAWRAHYAVQELVRMGAHAP
ncbi:MAG: M48 family metallopeptidase [Burkholderiaceae bacterium]|jgi:Zn-dependent protease with chaperone function|nr:M48 family metallopeptidase [Burkholderiaceae bacterium]